MRKKISELYAFTNEKMHGMEQNFIDEVARQVKERKEQLFAAIQLFDVDGCEHSHAYRFQQVEDIDPKLVNFEIAHYYTYRSNLATMQNYIEKPVDVAYSYFDFMIWFYFVKGIVFDYNGRLFMKIKQEYNEKKYYFGDKISVDEYYDAMLNKYRPCLNDEMREFFDNYERNEAKKKQQLGEISGYVRNPFLREYAIPITSDIVVVETPTLTSCLKYYPHCEKEKVKVYHGHKYERPGSISKY